MEKIQEIISWFQTNWVQMTVIALAFQTFLKAIRDAVDKTPETDDNWFEKMCTVIGKVIAYITTGKRA